MELCKEYKSMNCNEKTEKISESFDIDSQLNLPQYLDDIERLVKCSVSNVACDYEFNGDSIKLYGKTIVSILYVNSEGCPLSNEFEEEFSKSFDLKNCEYFYFADVKLQTKYHSHRLVNQRRIDVHSSVGVCIDVYCKTPSKCLSSCKEAFVRDCNKKILSDTASGICSCEFDESFAVVKNDSKIKNIVNTFLNSFIEDKKIIKDKMLVKIRNEASVIYISDNDSFEKCRHTFSISRIIDVCECCEEDKAFVCCDTSQLYVKAKCGDDNTLKEIEIVGKLSLNYKVTSELELPFVTDSYIPEYNISLETASVILKNNPIYYFDDKTCELPFDCDKSIIEVVDLKAYILDCNIEKSVLKATVCLNALYKDDTTQLCYLEKCSELTLNLSDEPLDGFGNVNIISYDFNIKNTDKISLRLNYEYTAFLFKSEKVSYVTDIQLQGEKQSINMPELTLYFADKNENVWDIAKSFSSSKQLIIDENNLSSDIIDSKRVLLVPGM